MPRATPARWGVWEALSPPFGLAVVALGGAKLNGVGEKMIHFGLDPAFLVFGGLLEVIVGLCIFFRPTRLPAAVVGSVWLAAVWAWQLMNGYEGVVPISGVIALGTIGIALYEWWHRASVVFRFPQPLAHPPSGARSVVAFLLSIVGVSFLIRWAVGGTTFWLSIPLLALGDVAQRGRLRDRTEVLRTLLTYLLVLGIGVSSWWGFVGHYFMSDAVAASVGWDAGSPFQLELAFYHLGFGIVASMCLWFRDDFWVAALIPICVFALGAASIHVTDFVRHGNTAPGNWGFAMLFGDVVIPAAMLSLLWVYRRRVSQEVAAARLPHRA